MSFLDMFTRKDKNQLSIIIVGCGKVGTTLIKRLSEEGHNITFIDTDQKIVDKVMNAFDVMGIVGNGASYTVQMEAGIEVADLFIAVTESDELNLLCCTIAKKFGDCSAVARVRNPVYSEEQPYLREKLGLSMIINPELEAAREISRILRLPVALSTSSFAKGQAELIRFQIPQDSYLDGRVLFELQKEFDFKFLICGVERDDSITIPNGYQRFQAGDIITMVATARNAYVFFKKTGLVKRRISNAMIIGGGKTSFYLSKQLTSMGINVTLVENNQARCEELSELLNGVLIINGDGTDEDLLMTHGIETTDAFIPLTGIDEENILLTLYAKRVTNAKVITKVNRINFNSVIRSLELGSVINPRTLTAEEIIAYVRGMKNSIGSGNIETLYHWFDDRAEAIEFKVTSDSEVTDTPLCDLKLKSDLLVACISRDGKIIIPRGQDYISKGDSVTIVTTHTGFKNIVDILE
ncbi:MAG: Trk system potassium transporter TrkA [Acutalibacteraceae bacterium]|nr:Trk system potassium transporter TrkA [Acutalibacteraceae bacterium]